jgi:uncharacterized MAPEG superfamily protein
MTTLQKMLQVKLEFSVPGSRVFTLPPQSEAGVRQLLSVIHGQVGSGWSQLWFILIGFLVCAMAPAAVNSTMAFIGGRFSNAEHRFGADVANNGWLKASVRAQAASANSFESLPLFVGAVLACTMFKVDAAVVHVHCWLWIAARLVYLAVYVLQVGPLAGPVSCVRTAVWASSIILLTSLLGAAVDAQSSTK